MNRFYVAAVALVGTLGFSPIADAQIRIGPFGGVNVRVPFVAVDVLPFGGGTRVRAPFTSVGTGLYGGGYYGRSYDYGYASRYRGYARPYYYDPVPLIPIPVPVPVYPVYPPYVGPGYLDDTFVYPEPYAEAPVIAEPGYVAPEYRSARPVITSPQSLEDDLRAAADRLARSLSRRRDDADVWMNYLQPDQIIDAIDRGGSPSELQSLLRNYEGLSGNSQLSHIWVSDGFRQTHQLLRQWVESSAAPQAESDGPSVLEPSENEPTLAKPPRKAAPADVEDLPVPRPTTSL